MRRLVAVTALCLSTSCARETRSPEVAPPPQPAPDAAPVSAAPAPTPAFQLVVTIVVDQLAAWVMDERLAELPSNGGFARLARQGTRVREMRYAHAVTDTAPGHASLYSAEVARDSGIFGNEIFDEASRARVSILFDPNVALVTTQGVEENVHSSSAARVTDANLATRFRRAHPDAAIVSVSLKDRGAIFGGGRAPTTAVWYDVPRGDWVTSTAFARELPWWARTSPLAKLSAEWTLEDGEWVRAHAATPDDAPGEGNYGGLGTTFPHPVGRAKEPNVAFRASPMANEAVLGLALAALRETKNTKDPILLAISLSANDYVGHVFGPDSWEAWDELHRLDASLARFFRELDGQFGENGWAAVLAADHGVTRMPEAMSAERILAHCGTKDSRWHRPCEPGLRILPDPLGPELDRVAARALGAGHWVSGVADPYVYLTDAAKQLPEAKRRALDEALTRALLAKPGIKSVYNARDTSQATCPPQTDESEAALVCRSIPAGVPGELYVVAREGGFFDPSVVVGKGASHGAPYISDRTVPLFARAPGVIAAGDVLETAGFELFARTASELLGLQIPPAARTVPTLLSNLPKKGGE